MKEEKLNLKEQGITLIALVVTIIILLILAGVTINMALKENGLFKMAFQSREISKDVEEEERVKLAITDALIKGTGTLATENLEKAIGKEFGEDKISNLTGNGPWIYEGERKTYTIDGAGNLGEQKPTSVEDLKVGDWVEYNSSKGNIKCRVLYDTSYDEKNSTNYGVQIIASEDVSEVTLGYNDDSAVADPSYGGSKENFLKAIDSYNKSVEKLTELAKGYKNDTTDYVEEVRCVGSKPDFIPDTPSYESHIPWNVEDCVYNGGPMRVQDENYIKDYEQLQIIDNGEFLNNSDDFWWASCGTKEYSVNLVKKTGFGMVRFWMQGYANNFNNWRGWEEEEDSTECMFFLRCEEETGSDFTKGLRPVFKLKPGVVLTGSGTQENCYTFKN